MEAAVAEADRRAAEAEAEAASLRAQLAEQVLALERLHTLEQENKELRRKLEALTVKASPEVEYSRRPPPIQVDGVPSQRWSRSSSSDTVLDIASPRSPPASRAGPGSPAAHRGFTIAGLAEAEEVEQESLSELWVKVMDEPRRCIGVMGACTVVKVRTTDRPALLESLATALFGVDLSIARATFETADGLACNEFWVQEASEDGSGPVLEDVKRRRIEQRLRQWCADRGPARPQRVSGAALGRAPDWPCAEALPPHAAESTDAAERESLLSSLASALSVDGVSWLGALPPVLARQTAAALLPRMHRLRVEPGGAIEQCGDDFLLLLETALPVACGTETDPAAEPRLVLHPVGSVLCLASTVERDGERLAWASLSAPGGGTVAVVGREALRELMGETRKVVVRRQAKQLASAAAFAPLGSGLGPGRPNPLPRARATPLPATRTVR